MDYIKITVSNIIILIKISSRAAIHAGKATLSNFWIKSLVRTEIVSGLDNAGEYFYNESDYTDRETPVKSDTTNKRLS